MAEMMVRRVGVFSLAKMQGLIMFVVGLIIGVIYGLAFMALGATMSSLGPRDSAAMGGISSIVIGLILMIAIPIFYGIIGFIGGAIGGFVYNIAAGIVGGIKLDLESTTPQYTPPPPPQQWGPGQYQQS